MSRRVVRGAALGALVGFLAVMALGATFALLSGYGGSGAIGLGLFAGVWGGPGFGAMLGASMALRNDGHDDGPTLDGRSR